MTELVQLEQRLAAVERELADQKAQAPKQRLGNPWKRMKGMLADEPLFDEWKQAIEDYRRQWDNEPVEKRALLDDIQRRRADMAAGLAQPLAAAFDDVREQLGLAR